MNSKISAENFVLLLLNSNNQQKIEGKLCFQKEMFLIVKEICPDLDLDLNFQPYHYGPYSKRLSALLYELKSDSLIEIDERKDTCTYSITSKGVKMLSGLEVSEDILEKISNLKNGSQKLGYKRLLRYVYFNYPEYTVKSRIKNKLMGEI